LPGTIIVGAVTQFESSAPHFGKTVMIRVKLKQQEPLGAIDHYP
jgi:hypothetical protein